MSRAKRRRYDATGRKRRAAESHERVLSAAGRLFAERGYAETTIEDVAREAGVAAPTIYATFRAKRGLLAGLLDRLVSNVPGGPPLLDTAGPRAVLAATEPTQVIARFAHDIVGVQDRVGPIYEVMKSAARTQPDVAELAGRAQDYRNSNIGSVAARLAELGSLRPGLSVEDATRTIWVLASYEARQLLVVYARWSVERYRDWLAATLSAALLGGVGPRHGRRPRRREIPAQRISDSIDRDKE